MTPDETPAPDPAPAAAALTPEAIDRYVAGGGDRCPFCGSDEFEGGPFTAERGACWQKLTCNVCAAVWEDQYVLRTIAVVDAGTGVEAKDGPGRYRVHVYEREDDGRLYPLGTWIGTAESRDDARKAAIDELWDDVLEGCAHCESERLEDEDDEETDDDDDA